MDNNIKNYALVTAAYWGYTVTDGALRMLVLLHFNKLGFTPIEIAFLFLFYEIFGIVTNFLGGWIGSQFGLRLTLYGGIGLQIFALVMLGLINPNWAVWFQVVYVMTSQAFSGIAKDLTKMSSKSAVRLVVPKEAESKLFKWVAILTGSKNALKGIGFFVGATLLQLFGFEKALFYQAAVLFIIFLSGRFLPKNLGKIKAKVKFKQLFSKSKAINILSAARFFLFGARDIWFVVALPVFFRMELGWSFIQVGTYMACWVIGYGIVQSLSPTILRQNQEGKAPQGKTIQIWTSILTIIPAAIALAFMAGFPPQIVITGGLIIFGIVFAFNSAVHSYLVLAYTEDDDVALNVGFYYMANSGGRLLGTITSGIVYQTMGIEGCLWFSSVFVLVAALVSAKLPPVKVLDSANELRHEM
ncbi:organoarsenical effux MFS transporter ArsJ [Cyanobacterium aponinum UTEX 3221]|uniref:Major facilitator superfamily MFS_1 n=2 Tax=Cyanobacterium aponinum TaxID=379064 RepID=K9Z319_CYAAP|nr:organoarsenical effux MFS transporter ArsJ [Cyanobacterium aponinum]AFZ52748.1 major facilitator superfamily MFS_1 [Cyanobacterium aponinum PCC 10605]MBD2392872.1 organoarsenical effux MFS transporter ArsJ [Cyanobacterium aponinum FACHB-4101]MTF37943.1 organoarsenical effux MFS transporter ArsJ [Cyanobacterium aponinum 0216]WRL39010.1 organoarsenical effux MFS transporter ArsJ [Cyanobacterium aponinum UTEX 3221]